MLFIVHDWETTGLPFHADTKIDKQPRGIEFAAILTDGKEVIDKMEFICNPNIPIEPIITKITGLTNEDLELAENFDVYIPQVKEFLSRGDAIISHNLSFDRGIMEFEMKRRGLSLADVSWPQIEICTVEQSLPPFGRRMKMEELYNMFCGEYVQKHRAMDDVLLLNELCVKMGVFNVFSAA